MDFFTWEVVLRVMGWALCTVVAGALASYITALCYMTTGMLMRDFPDDLWKITMTLWMAMFGAVFCVVWWP